MVRAVLIGSSTSSFGPRAVVASSASVGFGLSLPRPSRQAMKPVPSARAAKGSSGTLGIRPIRPAVAETTPG